jgi:hypothetical protein
MTGLGHGGGRRAWRDLPHVASIVGRRHRDCLPRPCRESFLASFLVAT